MEEAVVGAVVGAEEAVVVVLAYPVCLATKS